MQKLYQSYHHTRPEAIVEQMYRQINALKQERRDVSNRDGSPSFLHTFGVIAATTGREYIEVATRFPAARRYEPLDTCQITNRATESLSLEVNGRIITIIPSSAVFTLSDQAIWSLALINNEGTATTDAEITARFFRAPLTVDKIARGYR